MLEVSVPNLFWNDYLQKRSHKILSGLEWSYNEKMLKEFSEICRSEHVRNVMG